MYQSLWQTYKRDCSSTLYIMRFVQGLDSKNILELNDNMSSYSIFCDKIKSGSKGFYEYFDKSHEWLHPYFDIDIKGR